MRRYFMSYVTATYQTFGDEHSFERKAEGIALGLTIGSWTDLPLLEQQQLAKHKGQVIKIEVFPDITHPNNPTKIKANISIQFPQANFSADIPAILTTIFGKLSLDGEIKLIDIQFSPELAASFPGPKFGLQHFRNVLNVYDRPFLMSIFKGVIGKDLHFLGEQLREQALGGVDFIKDDEILFEHERAPFIERIKLGKKVLQEVYEQTGHRTLYAVNLTGRTTELLQKAIVATELGADALLFNVHTYGLDILQQIVEHPDVDVPIMAHPALSGAMISSPTYGISSAVLLGTLSRIAGADFSLFPSPYGSVALEKTLALQTAQACLVNEYWKQTIPVPSAGIHPGMVPQLIQDFGIDCVINAGGGIHGHPEGAQGGGRAFRQAIDGTLQGLSLEQTAKQAPALAQALAIWGS